MIIQVRADLDLLLMGIKEKEGVREWGSWEVSMPSFQFCCELNTALKNSL